MASAVKRPDAYPGGYAAVGHGYGDVESLDKGQAFAYQHLRQGFVSKVYGLLAAQLLLTVLVAAPIVLSPAVKGFVATNSWVLSLAALGSFVLILVLSFSESARQSHPTNLVLLGAFTACEGLLVGAISASYQLHVVAAAVLLTGGIATALAVYAARTKTDYTAQGGALLAALTALLLTGLLAAFTRSKLLDLAVAGGGAMLFSFYIVFDVQMLVGGHHAKFQLSPDDYVTGAIALYLDVINLFLYILRLLGSERD